ncbi:hypothetical protein [Paenibacillus sinopodophylli]|uniref:hypothetical protein n=1 Tax=Paenibacillus sinopodophylli TaxID=1837342 RepID=UPI00110D233E|nr:hypothetical protein [Paenibacillus sinopodophylli]
MKTLLQLIPACVPNNELKSQTNFEWYEEPVGTTWTLSRVNEDYIHIKIVSYKDIDHKQDQETEIDFTCRTIDFVGKVVKILDLLIKTHGIVGFKECWHEHDFPKSSYLKLKNFYITSTTYCVFEYEDKGCPLAKTDINKDIELLFRDIQS